VRARLILPGELYDISLGMLLEWNGRIGSQGRR